MLREANGGASVIDEAERLHHAPPQPLKGKHARIEGPFAASPGLRVLPLGFMPATAELAENEIYVFSGRISSFGDVFVFVFVCTVPAPPPCISQRISGLYKTA